MRHLQRLAAMVLIAIALATTAAAQAQQELTPYCTREDRQFVDNYEKFGAFAAAFVAAFLLPFLSAMVPFQGWSFLNPHKRWAIVAMSVSLLVLIAFAGLPMLAASRWIAADNGLLVYPGVEPQYILSCRPIRVRGTPLFGILGDAKTTSIGQPYYLLLGLVAALALWTALVWVAFRLARRRFGLRP